MMPVSPLISKISKVSTFVDPLIVTLFDLPSISPKMYPTETSWAEKQEEARIARERKRYEASINEVTTELESMRTKVAELLEENNRLPESERMDGKFKNWYIVPNGKLRQGCLLRNQCMLTLGVVNHSIVEK